MSSTTDQQYPLIITLSEHAAEKLSKILQAPATKRQKQTQKRSKGMYAFYQKTWKVKSK